MALKTADQKFCKVIHNENGKSLTRRVHTMVVQDAEGRVHWLSGDKLPESITLHTGHAYRGAHLAEVLLNPKKAKAIPLSAAPTWSPSPQNVLYLVAGMVFYGVIRALIEASIQSLV